MKTDKECWQCEHFIQHYINIDYRGFVKTCGHCVGTKRMPIRHRKDKACEYFSEKIESEVKKAKQECVRDSISQIEETLHKLLEYVEEN